MNLYLLSQDENGGYDTYDSCVVAAESEDAARLVYPTQYVDVGVNGWTRGSNVWASTPDRVTVKFLGIAAVGVESGVVCASFHAG